MAQLREWTAHRVPLITLQGPGGMGKTTLARLHAQEQIEAGRGVVFVELCTVTTPAGLKSAVLRALVGPGSTPEAPSPERLAEALLAVGPVHLVLDNLEQLLPEAATAIAEWIDRAPELSICVTSRQALQLSFEQVLPLGPLDEASGPALFLARLQPGLPELTPKDHAAALAIVRAVDGIPLAIELAAARARTLGLTVLAEQLARDPVDLGTGPVDAPARHQTLEAAIEGSLTGLRTEPRRALAMAARFREPFGAAALAQALDRPVLGVADVLAQLRDASLLRELEPGIFGMYAPIRHYVARLALDRDDTDADARYQTTVLDRADRGELRVGDLLAIAEQAPPCADPDLTLRVLRAACRLPLRELVLSGHHRLEGSIREALLTTSLPEALRARARCALGDLEWARDRYPEALADARAALKDLERVQEDQRAELTQQAYLLIGRSCFGLATFDEAEQALTRALDAALSRGDRWAQTEILQCFGAVRQSLGRHAEADSDLLHALELARSIDATDIAAHVEASLGAHALDLGRLRAAEERLRRAADLATSAHLPRTARLTQGYLALALFEQQAFEEADALLAAALDNAERGSAFRLQGLFSAFHGAVLAGMDRLAEAEAAFLTAARLLPAGTHWDKVRRALEGHLHLARARNDTDPDRIQRQRHRAEGGLVAPDDPDLKTSDDLRMTTRILERALRRAAVSPESATPSLRGSLWIGPELRWFSLDGGPRVDLARRPLLRCLLGTLAEQRVRAPSQVIGLAALAQVAWPHERYLPEVHLNRLHVALSTLRKLGLRRVLVREELGYRLDPAVEVHHFHE